MSDVKTNNKTGMTVASLKSDGQRLDGAMKNELYGPQVLALLSPEFQTDYAAELDKLMKLGEDHAVARGAIHGSTETQRAALAGLREVSSVAREAARASFVGNDALLHGEFQVGRQEANDLASIIERSHKLVAACKDHAEALQQHGWLATQTTALEAALKAVEDAKLEVHYASDAKEGITGYQTDLANTFYRRCRVLQRAARVAYPASKAKQDASIYEARALFLLGEFPARNRLPRRSQEDPAPLPQGGGGTTGQIPTGNATGASATGNAGAPAASA